MWQSNFHRQQLALEGGGLNKSFEEPYKQVQNMSNDNNRDGNSSRDQIVEVTPTIWGGAAMAGEQPAAALGTIIIDQGTL